MTSMTRVEAEELYRERFEDTQTELATEWHLMDDGEKGDYIRDLVKTSAALQHIQNK